MPTITVKNLRVTYISKKKVETEALHGIDDTFRASLRHVILGKSGSGKSSYLMALGGFIAFDGNVYYDGQDIEKTSGRKNGVSYVSQNFDLYPMMTVFDNLAFPLKQKKMREEDIIKKVVEMASFLEMPYCLSRLPKELSIGQQQKVALGRALIKEPSLLLLDEPFANLDEPFVQRVLDRLKEASRKGPTMVYVANNAKEAVYFGQYFHILEEGRLVYSGDASGVYEYYRGVL